MPDESAGASREGDAHHAVGDTYARQGYATFEFKPGSTGYTGGGYPRWRSIEHGPESGYGSDDVFVPVHRLLAVVACYPAEMPLDEILADLGGRDVHHELGMPAANLPGELETRDHGDHSALTQRQRRAWAATAKQQALDPDDGTDEDACQQCGAADTTMARSADWEGLLCIECSKEASEGAPIKVV